ncbi:MAG: hypothetical protein V4543_08690 [Bacteroidota bacterium]
MRTFFITTAIILTSLTAKAQDAVFQVAATRGDVVTSKPNAADAKSAVAKGKRLYKNETLQIQSNGYIGLIHKSGQTMTIKKPGTYSVSDLDSKATAAATGSVSQRYANYVLEEITKDGDKDLKKNHQQFMAVTGAVMRAGKNASAVKPLIPPTAVLFSANNTIHWMKSPGAGNMYIFTVSDLYDETIFSKETPDTNITIDFSKFPRLKSEKMCLVRVAVKGKKQTISDQCALKFLPSTEAASISKDLTAMTTGPESNSSIGKVAQAYFYEQNGLFLDALNAYQEAVELEPDVTDYRDIYRNFLVKVGLLENPSANNGQKKEHN